MGALFEPVLIGGCTAGYAAEMLHEALDDWAIIAKLVDSYEVSMRFEKRADAIKATIKELNAAVASEQVNVALLKGAPDMLAVLSEVAEFLENQSDVKDGDYGQPEANDAMRLLGEVERTIAKAEGR